MSFVTQSRVLPEGEPFPWSYGAKSGVVPKGVVGDPMQVTTSYRTGGEADVDEGAPLDDSSRENFMSSLRSESKVRRTPYDNGHPFTTEKQRATISHPVVLLRGGISDYRGPLIIDSRFFLTGRTEAYPVLGSFDPSWYGPRAVEATRPTAPQVSLATLLGELRKEGLPDLPGSQSLRSKVAARRKLGGEYLNAEFGWKPIISDVQKTARAIADSKRILEQYRRDSGRNVRRRFTFPEVQETQSIEGPATVQHLRNVPNSSNFYNNLGITVSGKIRHHIVTTRQVWFSGCYTYYVPEGGSLWEDIVRFEKLANRLLGTRVTPEVVWNLAPWSWFADWNGNIGTQIANANALASDGLVMRYGYLMCKTRSEHRVELDGITIRGVPYSPVSHDFVYTKKERIRASPYGFGSDPAGYTPRQWAILGALGMTKGPRTVRHE